MERMTEEEFLEKGLQNGYTKKDLLLCIREAKNENKRLQSKGINLPVDWPCKKNCVNG